MSNQGPSALRYLIAFNPNCGRGTARARAEELRRSLCSAGAHVTIRETRADENVFLRDVAEEAGEAPEAVVVMGGDGTLHEAANGLPEGSPPVLFCGAGTVNIFGAELSLDGSVDGCVELLRRGRRASLPLLEAGPGRRFVLFLEVGFLGRAVARVNEVRRRRGRHGRIEFVTAFFRECFGTWGRRVTATADGGEPRAYSNVLVTRARRYADRGRIPMAGGEPLLRGEFTVVGYRTRTPLGHLVATGIVAGGLLPWLQPAARVLGLLEVFTAQRLHVRVPRPEPGHADAETLDVDELDVRPGGRLAVVVPARAVDEEPERTGAWTLEARGVAAEPS